jgi:hypothetical protein
MRLTVVDTGTKGVKKEKEWEEANDDRMGKTKGTNDKREAGNRNSGLKERK